MEKAGEECTLPTFIFGAPPTWGGMWQVGHRTGPTWGRVLIFREVAAVTLLGLGQQPLTNCPVNLGFSVLFHTPPHTSRLVFAQTVSWCKGVSMIPS